MDTITIDNIKFYNQRKLAAAKAVSDDLETIIAEYDKLGGKYEVMETKKPVKKVVKKRAKKVSKK
jgi:hypothetical protein